MTPFLTRARRVINRHGLRGTARLVVKKARPRASEQVWYRLDLGSDDRPRRTLEEPFVLRRGGPEDTDLVAQLPRDAAVAALTDADVRSRLDRGADLPPDTVLLEDSIASPHFRGRSVAPRAWSEIGDALRAEGFSAMTTKVGVENEASRRAVEKAGFRAVGKMRNEQSPWRSKVRVDLAEDDDQTHWLRDLETD